MQQINITQKITEAENLILDLKPVLEIYGTFEYEILLKGKEEPKIFLQMYFSKKNSWTSIVMQVIQKITKRNFFFTLETIEDQTKITLNIVI
jgi:hypothetical protein